MGFRNFRSFNLAMLCKQAWRLQNKNDSLVARIYKARYYPQSSFLDAKCGSNPSLIWRSLLETQDIIRRHCSWRVETGRDILIWRDKWLLDKDNPKITTLPFPLMENATVNMIMNDTEDGWDEEATRQIFNTRDTEQILKIPLSRLQAQDKVIWPLEDNGLFSVKSCYRAINGELQQEDRKKWASIWKLKIPPKVKMFFWQVCTGCLLTRDLLRSKKVECEDSCPLCNMEKESIGHIFFDCAYAKEVWNIQGVQIHFPTEQTLYDGISQIIGTQSREQTSCMITTCWEIWKQRSSKIWENKGPVTALQTVRKAMGFLDDWRKVNNSKGSEENQGHNEAKWKKPEEGFLKLNVDAAIDVRNARMGFGCVLRDKDGGFVAARGIQQSGAFSPREEEAVAVRESLSWIKELAMDNILVETDSLKVVKSLENNEGHSYFNLIISDIRNLIGEFSQVFLSFVKRSANRAAHYVAKQSVSTPGYLEWFDNPPPYLCNLLYSDLN